MSTGKFWGVLLAALTAVSVLSPRAAQAQSIYGPGGLFLNPTADFPARGQISPAALGLPQKLDDSSHRLTWTSYSLDYGLSDRVEVGATYLKVNPKGADFQQGSFGGYVKYRVLAEKAGRPALAIGGNLLGGGDSNARTAFAVLRYTPTPPGCIHQVHLHLGTMYIDELEGIKRRQLSPYAGVDLGLTHHLSAFAEIRNGLDAKSLGPDGTHAPKSIGVVWKPVQNYKLVVVYGTNGWNAARPQFGVGVGYSIRGGR